MFDYVSKGQLLIQIVELGINSNLVTQTSSFLTDQKVQLVINKQDNKEREIEIKILQSSLILSILFLINISKIFNKVAKTSSLVTFLSFINDLGFIAFGSSVKKIIKALEKVAKKVIEWEKLNTVTYDMSKIEVVFFAKSY